MEPSNYQLESRAKITNGLFRKSAILASDNTNIYILSPDTRNVEFTLPINKIKKAYAQLGELYIKYGFGKMMIVRFVQVGVDNLMAATVSPLMSDVVHLKQASAVQDDVKVWIQFFNDRGINAKQQLSPKKATIIIVIMATIVIVGKLLGLST